MTADPEDVARWFASEEVAYAKRCVEDADELLALTESGLAIGGHWNGESERYGELCAAVAAQRAFPARPWWDDPDCILDRDD
jgi:hypothetical protein